MLDFNTVFLVVDDFEPMRTVTIGQLHDLGANHVLSAAHAADALASKCDPVCRK